MAISSGSSSGAIRLRRIMMLVSSRPRRTGSPVISATGLIGGGGLVGPERIRVDRRGGARHRSELRPGHETAALAQRHQLADTVPVAGYREGLPALDRVHDLLGPHPQVPLGDLGLAAHGNTVAPVATVCYKAFQALAGGPGESHVYISVSKPHAKGPFSVRERASGLGSGGGI